MTPMVGREPAAELLELPLAPEAEALAPEVLLEPAAPEVVGAAELEAGAAVVEAWLA